MALSVLVAHEIEHGLLRPRPERFRGLFREHGPSARPRSHRPSTKSATLQAQCGAVRERGNVEVSMGQRIRGRRGVMLRRRRLARSNYLCIDCLNSEPRVFRRADVVDHVIPLALGGEDIDDNTRNLCNEHHQQRTAEQFGHRARVSIGSDGWPVG